MKTIFCTRNITDFTSGFIYFYIIITKVFQLSDLVKHYIVFEQHNFITDFETLQNYKIA